VVTEEKSSGIPKGSIGIITKIELITKKDYIFWVIIGGFEPALPLWQEEFEVLDGKR
jgi:hypothetical protein